MLRFGHLRVTLSNACEVRKVCRRYYTLSMAVSMDWDSLSVVGRIKPQALWIPHRLESFKKIN
jgi:hypothetical protein